MNKVLAAARAYHIDGLSEWEVPHIQNYDYEVYAQFRHDVDHFTMQIRLRSATRSKKASVGLQQNDKIKIKHHIEQIKKCIGEADLPEEKEDRLLDKLNDFALEVEKNRTGLAAAMAVWIALCDGIGQGFEKLEPARRWIDSIAAVMGKAKADEDAARPRIPAPREAKRLEPPRRSLPKPEPRSDALDDDIPF